MVFADDVTVSTETRFEAKRELKAWREALETRANARIFPTGAKFPNKGLDYLFYRSLPRLAIAHRLGFFPDGGQHPTEGCYLPC